ncbi:YeeE/YedE family protein [Pseudovibrio exalbescens]|uniref:YeeE/YedE family protein n=1 Tax=Pseudovibrio exalbescens TaxID=197461 RepID=UPI0004040BC5|nr:YeeE/YedE family protein [Pseudovibrio exalbescens]
MVPAHDTPSTEPAPEPQWAVIGVGLLVMLFLGLSALRVGENATFPAVLIGIAAGVSLYKASFGFTGGWRLAVEEQRTRRFRAQLALILLVCVISFPLLEHGSHIGLSTGGFVFPFGISAAIGAFLFGIGMRMAGGCGSGTLFTLGGGSMRMLVTLGSFVAGSVVATAHLPLWRELPALPAFSLVSAFGAGWALFLTALTLGVVALIAIGIEKHRYGELETSDTHAPQQTGVWSPERGAMALALTCIATFMFLGRPWGITSGFSLWGAKVLHAVGIPVENWPYWEDRMAAVHAPLFADTTSLMNLGIMGGALMAAGHAGRFRPTLNLSQTDLMLAAAGGMFMGYGARLAYGCNIGAYIGGITSGSLHGWLWLVCALTGFWVVSRASTFVYGRRVGCDEATSNPR